MKYGFLFVLLILNFNCNAQTNHIDYSTVIAANAEVAWNFVLEAKNLTEEEKQYFNNCTSSADRSIFSIHNVQIIASRVKALDAQREIEKILNEVKSKTNNIVWIREEIFRDMINKDITEYSVVSWMSSWDISTNYVIELGLRDDGVVVWRNMLNFSIEGLETNNVIIKK